MSLTFTSALCNDGRWYKNPIWRGTSPLGDEFFLCLDDDEPPELVVSHQTQSIRLLDGKLIAQSILDQLGIKATIDDNSFMKCGRTFVRDRPPEQGRGPEPVKVRKAFRFFLRITERPPPPTHHDKLWPGQPDGGVKYFFTTPPLIVPEPPKIA